MLTIDTNKQPQVLSVSQITSLIKGSLETQFPQIWIQGEISNFKPAASGHVYFSLKDQGAMISAAIFGWGRRSKAQAMPLKDGLQVVCKGSVSVYAPRGSYQFLVEEIQPLGAGALQLAFEELKAKLMSEGLFEPSKKKLLPKFPKKIAIITSPSGAAIRDILNVLERRAPHIEVLILPVLVQGEMAASQMIKALDLANSKDLADLILITRGGGSIEDLWCFNDEGLARAIARSMIPTISAVGHEVDFTISDFVSDYRAPTPSAAAEILSTSWVEVQNQLNEIHQRLFMVTRRIVSEAKRNLRLWSDRIVSPADRLREQAQRCDEYAERLIRAVNNYFQRKQSVFEQCVASLNALSPLRVLERGYAIVLDQTKKDKTKVIKSANELLPNQKLQIRFRDGDRQVEVV
jgi:exodeoxyribonuclease VII large subunit